MSNKRYNDRAQISGQSTSSKPKYIPNYNKERTLRSKNQMIASQETTRESNQLHDTQNLSQQTPRPESPTNSSLISSVSSSNTKDYDSYDHVQSLLSRGKLDSIQQQGYIAQSESNFSTSSSCTGYEFDHVNALLRRGSVGNDVKDDFSVTSVYSEEVKNGFKEEFDQNEALQPPVFAEVNQTYLNSINEENEHNLSPSSLKSNHVSLDEKKKTNDIKLNLEFFPPHSEESSHEENENISRPDIKHESNESNEYLVKEQLIQVEQNDLQPEEDNQEKPHSEESAHQENENNSQLEIKHGSDEENENLVKEQPIQVELNDLQPEEEVNLHFDDEKEAIKKNSIRHLEEGKKTSDSGCKAEEKTKSSSKPRYYVIVGFSLFFAVIAIILFAVLIPKKNDEEVTSTSSVLSGTENFYNFGKLVSISSTGDRLIVAGDGEEELVQIYNAILAEDTIGSISKMYTILKQNENVVSASSIEISGEGNHFVLSSKLVDSSSLVQVFSLSSDGVSWTQVSDNIGTFLDTVSLSISNNGSVIAIGVPSSSDSSVYVYKLDNDTWSLVGSKLIGSPEVLGFGTSISLSSNGNRIAVATLVSSTTEHLSGYTSIYEFDGNDWNELGDPIQLDEPLDYKLYPLSVSLNAAGDLAAVGYPGYSWNELVSCGLCRIYKYDEAENKNWMRFGESIIGESTNQMLGKVVSLSANGNMVGIGSAPDHKIHIYELSNNNTFAINSYNEEDSLKFGADIDLSSDGAQLIVGAPGDRNDNIFGKVHLYPVTPLSTQS